MNWDELLSEIDPLAFFDWMGWTLKRSGLTYRGSCPIHHGNNKSAFSFSPKHRLFFCATHCGCVGDFIGVYMKANQCSIEQAKRAIAEWMGVNMETVKATPRFKKVRELVPLPDVQDLPEISERDRKWLKPLSEHERFSQASIERFYIQWSTWGRYANRIVFPIWDPFGKWVGNNGRWIGNDFEEKEVPKYLYSSAPFQTGSVLYGYHLARDASDWILHEGVTDVIAAYEYGYEAIAVLGCSLTLEQISILLLDPKPIVLGFDGDAAGKKGIRKAIHTLFQYGITDVSVMVFPDREDAGSAGKEMYHDIYKQKISAIEFLQQHPN